MYKTGHAFITFKKVLLMT